MTTHSWTSVVANQATLMRISHRKSRENRKPKALFVMVSQHEINSFPVPVRHFRLKSSDMLLGGKVDEQPTTLETNEQRSPSSSVACLNLAESAAHRGRSVLISIS